MIRAWVGVISLLAMLFAVLQLERSSRSVESWSDWAGNTPVRAYRDAAAQGELPLVVIAHGFAGSQELMQAYAITLARRGYMAVSFDFLGHGRHPEGLSGDITSVDGATQRLLEQTAAVIDYALALPGVRRDQVVLLGHSMATDVLVRLAAGDPRVISTVAISPYSPAITAEAPRNLLMLVGESEGRLREEALRVLALTESDPQSGQTYGSFAEGTARRLAVIPGADHVTVLYRAAALQESAAWLDRVYDRVGTSPVDSRGQSIVLLLVAWLAWLWRSAAMLPQAAVPTPQRGSWRQAWPVVVGPMLWTPLLLFGVPADALGMLVGGYVALHFAVYGLLSLLFWGLRHLDAPWRWPAPLRPAVLFSCLAWLFFSVGLLVVALDRYVTAFWPTPERLPLLLWTLAATLVYFGAELIWAGQHGTPRAARLVSRIGFLLSLGIAVAMSFAELFFLLLIAMIVLLVFVIYGLFDWWTRRAGPWPGALASALVFAWGVSVTFPVMYG